MFCHEDKEMLRLPLQVPHCLPMLNLTYIFWSIFICLFVSLRVCVFFYTLQNQIERNKLVLHRFYRFRKQISFKNDITFQINYFCMFKLYDD